MPAPLVAIPPIVTTIGRFAVPYLAKELGKIGTNKFIQTYGKDAFASLNETLTAEKPMVNQDNIPMVNPSFKAPGVIAPDAEEIEREAEKIREMTKPIGFPADPPIKPNIKTGETTPPKIDTKEEFPLEDKIPDTLSTPIPEPEGPQIYYNRDAELKEGLEEYERIYSEERFAKANKEYPKYDPVNTKKIVEADKHFGAVSLGRKYGNDMDNVQLIYISPDEYLNLATEINPDSDWSKAKIEYLENKIRQGKEIGEIPILFVGRKGEDYTVRGHEGRHRAQAFKNAGYDKIPVRIEGFGKDKENNVENKLYTATKRSYLYNEQWAQDYIGFIPKRIVTERLKEGMVLSGEEAFSINLSPGDFYDVLTKNKLFEKENVNEQTEKLVRGIGDNNPPSPIDDINSQTEKILDKKTVKEESQEKILGEIKPKSYTIQNHLNDKLMDELLVLRGGIKGFKKRMSSPLAPMPSSTKAKMEIQLQKKLFDKYGFGYYPEGENPNTMTPERKEELLNRHDRRIGAIEYITSVAYDVIGEPNPNSLFVVDEDGLPIAAAKIDIPGKGQLSGSDIKSTDAVVITEMGSVFREANDQLFNDIIQKAKDEGRRFVVAEDLTSEKAYQAVKNRGFKDPTTKDTKKFKGKKIRRPNGKTAYQKNLVYIIK